MIVITIIWHFMKRVLSTGSKRPNPAYLAERRRDQEATEDMKMLKKGVVLVKKGGEVGAAKHVS